MKCLILFSLLILFVNAEKARFDNYRVYSVFIENEEQYEAMKYLEDHSDAYDFWKRASLGKKIDILVPPHKFSDFEEIMVNLKMHKTILIDNLQRLIDGEQPNMKQRKELDALDWTSYHRLDTIFEWMDQLVAMYPNILNITTIGHSYEGRPIKMITLSKRQSNRAIVLEGTIHAREWISPATATWILNELLTNTSSVVADLAEYIDWHIIPVVNPDGYEFTHTSNRMWRKTRAPVSSLCFGVDGNRNFGYNWLIPDETGNLGGSTVPCTDVYSGSAPYSEPETQATEGFLQTHAPNIDAYLALHSYGHLFLHPWGHTTRQADAVVELGGVGRAAADAIVKRNGIQYTVGSSNGVLYATTGTSRDHSHGAHHVPISFTVEMRGNGAYGNYGFVLPADHILPNAEEVFDGIIAMIHKAREFSRFPRN